MSGRLYIVGTPIGNLSDMTYRAVKTLEEVDFIAAEDTRVTLKLLNHFGIKKPLVSYHQHSTKYVEDGILDRIAAGESCAVVTDAGMPCVSDPGEDLVIRSAEMGIDITVVPGPVAAVSALAMSALPTSRFSFEGFLSTAKKQRYEHLSSLKDDPHTLIFYEAPHKLQQTLSDMAEYFGGDRKISICRELTKLHEQVIRTTLSGAVSYYTDNPPRGEFVLVVEGAKAPPPKEISIEEAVAIARELTDGGMRAADACKEAAKQTGFKKSEIYRLLAQTEQEIAD